MDLDFSYFHNIGCSLHGYMPFMQQWYTVLGILSNAIMFCRGM